MIRVLIKVDQNNSGITQDIQTNERSNYSSENADNYNTTIIIQFVLNRIVIEEFVNIFGTNNNSYSPQVVAIKTMVLAMFHQCHMYLNT